MAERKAVNKYYPPEWTPGHGSINKFRNSHPLRDRARKLHLGILVIRFEMPYNIWCDGCGNHIGTGVRYNAEKSKVGMYYSTPIYKFRMKCHLCDNHFEIKTDPQSKKKELHLQAEKDRALLKKSSLHISLVPETAEDSRIAKLLTLMPTQTSDERQRIKRNEIAVRPIFSSASSSTTKELLPAQGHQAAPKLELESAVSAPLQADLVRKHKENEQASVLAPPSEPEKTISLVSYGDYSSEEEEET